MKIGMELILSALLLFSLSTPVHAASDAVLDGAKKEGQVVFSASMEAQSAQRITATHPDIMNTFKPIGN
jgi:hypothetical protein